MRRRSTPFWVPVLCAALICAPGAAQDPLPSSQKEPARLKVTTRLVQVNVIVHDRHGQPVSDLTREDFTIKDGGVEYPAQQFAMETNQALIAKQPSLPPNTYSNRIERRGQTPTSVTVVLFDLLNTARHDQVYARDQIIRFLGQLQPQDRIALYALGGKVEVLHDFTSDASSIIRVLAKNRGRIATELDASMPEDADTGSDQLDAWMNDRLQNMANFYITNRVYQTCEAMEAIAHHLSNLPGRKNLVWVSGSFPISFGLDTDNNTTSSRTIETRHFGPEIERATRALSDANLAVYPVDARGLIGAFGPNFNMSQRGTSRIGKAPPSPFGGLSGAVSATHDTMQLIAQRTGGRAFYNTNDITGAVRRAIEDSRVTYVLGYYPTTTKWDGKFHEIKVSVKRPGMEVRHRKGYYAWQDLPTDERSRSELLANVVHSPLDANGLGLLVQVKPPSSAGDNLRVVIKLDPREVNFGEDEGRQTAELDLLFNELGADGRVLKAWSDTMHLRLLPATYKSAMEKGLFFERYLETAVGASQMRVVVRDARSGSVGSLNFTIPVPTS